MSAPSDTAFLAGIIDELATGQLGTKDSAMSIGHRTTRALFLAFLVAGLVCMTWVVRLPAIRATLGLSDGQIGIALLSTAVGSLLAIPAVGRLSLRYGSDVVLRWSLPALAACACLIGLAPTVPLLLAAVVVTGACLGATDVTMNSQASLLERTTERPLISRMHASWSLGSACGAGVAGITAALDWPVIASIAIASTFAILVSLMNSSAYLPDATGEHLRARGAVRLPLTVAFVGVVIFLAFFIEGSVSGWSTLFIHDTFLTAASFAAIGYLVYELSMVAGRLGGDRVRGRWGDRRSAVGGSAIAAVGLAAVAMAPWSGVAILGLVIVGLGQSVVVPIAFASAGRQAVAVAAVAIARVGGFGYAGGLIGPAAFGGMAQFWSMRAGFAVLAGLSVLMTAVALWSVDRVEVSSAASS